MRLAVKIGGWIKLQVIKADIAVVGGGPAGLSAAYSAAKSGAKVILLEKDDAIAQNIRTSGVTWIREINRLGISSEYYNPISNYRFVSPSSEVLIHGSGSEPQSCVLDVRKTWHHLASLAAAAGADIMLKTTVINIIMDSGGRISGIKAKTMRGSMDISCRLVIDASGFSTFVGRKAGIASEWKRYGVGAEYECYCEHADADTWVLMVGKQYSEAGYAWIFPLSKNRVRIGIGVGRPESKQDPLDALNSMIEARLSPLDKMGKIQPIEFHYGFIPNQGLRKASVSDGLILVGDSAGQSNPLVLEGIRYAIEFGRLAGEIGAKSLGENSSKASLEDYQRIVKANLESKINSALKVQSRWLELSDEQWDKELEILRNMSLDEFLDFVKADFTASKMMKLALHHPKLAARRLFNMVLKS
jgi:digeranylgeranylglycerophospholipid reductase